MKTDTKSQADGRRKRRPEGQVIPLTSVACSASAVLTSQTSNCEPVMTEAQVEGEGVSVSH